MSQNLKLRVADDGASPSNEQPKQSEQPKQAASKPSKVLPTVRISFAKQQDILRAYAVTGNGKASTLKDVSEIVDMATTTISLANPFFMDVRLMQKTEAGLVPAPELLEYMRAYEWDKETAFHKLAPLFSKTWFWEALQPRLAFDKLTEDQVVTLLAEKSTAGPTYKSQLKMILEFLEAAGMIKRENGQVSALKAGQQTAVSAPPAAKVTEAVTAEAHTTPSLSPLNRPSVATSFAQKQGVISFDISVRVDMTELVGWDPARITAFFAGIAQVVSAKGMFEKDSVKE